MSLGGDSPPVSNRTVSDRTVLATGTGLAAVATLASLWAEFGLGLDPCRLCWWQRVALYPLVVVLAVAAWERRPTVYRSALPLVGFGLAVAAYQTAASSAGNIGCSTTCVSDTPLAGGLSLSGLSLVGFLAIGGLLGLLAVRHRRTV